MEKKYQLFMEGQEEEVNQDTEDTYEISMVTTDSPLLDDVGDPTTDPAQSAEYTGTDLFISEYAEGSSYNKYLEIYNYSPETINLNEYAFPSCSNGCDDGVSWDYPDNVEFEAGTIVTSGDVYVVCHGSADDLIQAECDQTFTYLSNGDDVFGLTQVGSGALLDIIGTTGDDPGSGWEVAGVSNGTKDHTLVRKASVGSGNGGGWTTSWGTWWDVNNNVPSAIGGSIQEVDVWAGLGYSSGKWGFSLTYQEWYYAADVERILDFGVSYDGFLSPSVTFHGRVEGNGAQDTGLATVIGISEEIHYQLRQTYSPPFPSQLQP